jgi:WD40 repeat protein
MGSTSSPETSDNTIQIWDVKTGAAIRKPLHGHTVGVFILLLILLMGGRLSPDPLTGPFESGMPRLVLQLAIL